MCTGLHLAKDRDQGRCLSSEHDRELCARYKRVNSLAVRRNYYYYYYYYYYYHHHNHHHHRLKSHSAPWNH